MCPPTTTHWPGGGARHRGHSDAFYERRALWVRMWVPFAPDLLSARIVEHGVDIEAGNRVVKLLEDDLIGVACDDSASAGITTNRDQLREIGAWEVDGIATPAIVGGGDDALTRANGDFREGIQVIGREERLISQQDEGTKHVGRNGREARSERGGETGGKLRIHNTREVSGVGGGKSGSDVVGVAADDDHDRAHVRSESRGCRVGDDWAATEGEEQFVVRHAGRAAGGEEDGGDSRRRTWLVRRGARRVGDHGCSFL